MIFQSFTHPRHFCRWPGNFYIRGQWLRQPISRGHTGHLKSITPPAGGTGGGFHHPEISEVKKVKTNHSIRKGIHFQYWQTWSCTAIYSSRNISKFVEILPIFINFSENYFRYIKVSIFLSLATKAEISSLNSIIYLINYQKPQQNSLRSRRIISFVAMKFLTNFAEKGL